MKMHHKYSGKINFYIRMNVETKNKLYLDSASMALYTCFAIGEELNKIK